MLIVPGTLALIVPSKITMRSASPPPIAEPVIVLPIPFIATTPTLFPLSSAHAIRDDDAVSPPDGLARYDSVPPDDWALISSTPRTTYVTPASGIAADMHVLIDVPSDGDDPTALAKCANMCALKRASTSYAFSDVIPDRRDSAAGRSASQTGSLAARTAAAGYACSGARRTRRPASGPPTE